jgi:hypothetical protein
MAFWLPRRKRPYVQADGGIAHERPKPVFSIVRFAILVVVLSWLAVTNTENTALRSAVLPLSPVPAQQQQQKETSSPSRNNINSTFESRKSTNYGLFHVKERILKVVVSIAGHEWSCYYDEPVYGTVLCRDILRNEMCHELPLLPMHGDIVYRLHRVVAMVLILSTCLAACMTTPIHWAAAADGALIPNSILSLFVDEQVRLAPAPILIQRLLYWNVFCYPALKTMYRVIEHQNNTSVFRTMMDSADSPAVGFWLSVLLVFVMAVVLNALSTFWNGTYLLRFEAISAILVGFHAKYRAAMSVEIFYQGISWNAATWTLLVSLVLHQSLATAGFWWVGHLAGQTLGQYQMDHYVSSSTFTFQRVMDWLNW